MPPPSAPADVSNVSHFYGLRNCAFVHIILAVFRFSYMPGPRNAAIQTTRVYVSTLKTGQSRVVMPCDGEMLILLSRLRSTLEIEQGRLMSYAELMRYAVEQLAIQKNVNVRQHPR